MEDLINGIDHIGSPQDKQMLEQWESTPRGTDRPMYRQLTAKL
jgi:hypothetical protein